MVGPGTHARTIAKAVREGQCSARDVAEAALARVRAVDGRVRAFWAVNESSVLARADEVDRAREAGEELGALAGVPVALKDNFVTRDQATTCGSKILANWTPPYDAAHVEALRESGAVVLGKVAMDEFAMGSSSENNAVAPVSNPWALDRVPGGSSGGSAAAVAAGCCPLALGTDTGGSVRQPASFCNLVGVKPTYGRVSRFGMVAFASSLDQAGVFARDARDAAALLHVLAGHDPRDSTSLDAAVPDWALACEEPVEGLRIGVDPRLLDQEGIDEEVRARFEATLEAWRALGAQTVEVDLPHQRVAVATYYVLSAAEASSNLARYDGVRYGLREEAEELGAMMKATREAGFGDEVKRRILLGTFVLRAEAWEEYYGRAMKVRTLVARDYERAFERCDTLATPTSPVMPFRRGERLDDPLAMYLSDVFTIGPNLAGLPAISVPAGFGQAPGGERLPIGIHLTAPSLREDTLFRAAAGLEASHDAHEQRAALEPTGEGSG